MSWVNGNKHIVRVIILVLFIVSLLGPWAYDLINVPAEYTCSLPNVRLYGDFCGLPMAWFFGFMMFAGEFFHILRELITGSFIGRGRELFGLVLYILPSLPLLTTLLLLWKKDSPRLRIFHILAWGLGCVFPLFALFFQPNVQFLRLWGPWLYIGVAVSAVVFELLMWKRGPAGNP